MKTILLLLLGSGLAAFAQQPIRIACGNGADFTSTDGKTWQADRYYTGGTTKYYSYAIVGSPDRMLYARSRVGFYGDFSYNIPAPNGSYSLTLKFAETENTTPGSRVFNVNVNGVPVLTNFDLVKDYGAYTAVDRQFPVQVTNGTVKIDVIGVTKVGTLSAIALEPVGGTIDSSAFVRLDLDTKGTWKNAYGAEGYQFVGDAASVVQSTSPGNTTLWPGYAQVSFTDALSYIWATSNADARALQLPNGARVAGTWYSPTSFSINVNLTDGATHQVAIYALDYDNGSRRQMVEVLDGSGKLLDSRSMANFGNGQYVVWNLSGSFKIRVTRQGGSNAVVSGIFLGTSSLPVLPVLSLSTPSLSFSAPTGSGGSAAQTVNISNTGGGSLGWTATKSAPWLNLSAASGTAPSGLSITVNPGSMAAGAYTDTITVTGPTGAKTVTVTMNVTATASVSFLSLDTTKQGWWRTYYGSDGYNFVGDTPSLPSYAQLSISGASTYTWADPSPEIRALQHVSGTARVAGTWYGSVFNIDLNFTDGASHQFALYATDYDNGGRSERIDVLDFTSGAVLNTQTLSSFVQGQYLVWNISGHVIIRATRLAGSNAVVSGLFFGPAGINPQPVLSLSSSSLSFAANVGGTPASQKVTVTNTGTGTLNWSASENASWITLPSTTGTAPSDLNVNVSSAGLSAGTYTENITVSAAGATGSPKTVTVTLVVSPATTPTGAAAAYVGGNTFLTGNWIGNYGSEGYAVLGQPLSLPSYVQMSVTGASQFTWYSTTTYQRALQYPNGGGRVAACWYSSTNFTFDLNFTGAQHRFTMYATDFDGQNRGEKIEIINADTGAVLDTRQVTLFQEGIYLSWNVAGHVRVRVTNFASPNAVISGLFFDSVPPPSLNISSNSINFAGVKGAADPIGKSVAISNPEGTVLNWTAAESAPWLTLSAGSGATPATLNLNASTSGLDLGTYTTQVTITSPGVAGSPRTIDVALNVTEAQVISQLPLASWTFDGGTVSGNTVLDTTPNHLDGTIRGNQGGVTFETGPNGTPVAVFDGASGYITTRTDPREAIQNDLTLAAWIRTTNSSRTETIIAKYDLDGSEDGYIFETTASGYLAMHFGGINVALDTPQDYVDGTTKINDGQWHHVVAIIRTSQDVQFYVDGGLSSVFYLTLGGGAIRPALNIGGPPLRGQSFFTGAMDEVLIYPRALNTSEIAAFFAGRTIITSAAGEELYNGIHLPKIFPPRITPTQEYRTPYYINNPPRVIPIDLGRQLFVDDFLIEKTTLQRVAHQAVQRSQPVLQPGSPISAGAWWNPTTQQYQLWYWDLNAPVPDSYRYAYSTDGINWIKPTFPDSYGAPNLNSVVRHGDTIWLDTEETDPSKRYKSFGISPGTGTDYGKIYVYYSPDGIHWGPRMDYNIPTISDRTTVFYNAFRKVWVNSDRGSVGLPATAVRPAKSSRSRYYAESKDIVNWTPADPAKTFWTGVDDNDPPYAGPGGEPAELYNLDAVAYESVMVGLFSWFHPGIGYRDHALPGPILTEVGVGFSRDGFSWSRPNRTPGPGPDGALIYATNVDGTWNAFNTQSTGGGFLVVGDELWFYFSARTAKKPNNGAFSTGLATLRRDGFFSMDAGLSPGTLTTRPVKFSGNRMYVNVNNLSGNLVIEALDENNNVIPGFEASNFVAVHANKTSQEVSWNGANIGTLTGRNVKFRFTLTNGSLYSFWVTSSSVGASNGYVAAGGPGFTTLVDTTGK